MLFFSILAGISPFLVAALEDKFKISFLTSRINFGGFEFQVGGNDCEIIIHDVRYYFFLAHQLFRFFLQTSYCLYLDLYWKKWLYGFPELFVATNTFDINISKIFFFGLAEQFNTKIPLILIIVPLFIRPFSVEIIFEPGSTLYRFSEKFSCKVIVVKTQNFF